MYKLFLVLLLPIFICATPKLEEVVHGKCSFERTKDTFNINQATDKAIIHWQDFSLAEKEIANFIQPSDKASILNRVIGNNPSKIYGKLTANGTLYLINQNGILVGPKGIIDAKNFIASTLEMANAEFLEDKLHFTTAKDAGFENQGKISADENIFLLAPNITNSGSIKAKKNAHFLAGNDILLTNNNIVVHVKGAGTIDNNGTIEAALVDLKTHGTSLPSLAINQGGLIHANSFEEKEGAIYLSADNGSITHTGEIIAESGKVHVLADEIHLKNGTLIDVSGAIGGEILIGGDHKGENPFIKNAENVRIEEKALLKANGYQGNAGKVVIFSNDTTEYRGFIEAKATGNIGNGGFAEVSGKKNDLVYSFADLTSKNQKSGTFYLDAPITVTDGGGAFGALTISTSLASANVTLDTGPGSDDVTFSNTTDPITWSADHTLIVIAGGSIDMSASGTTINSTSSTFMSGEKAIDFTANTALNTGPFHGIHVGGTLQSTSGEISLTGTGGTTGVSHGVFIDSGTITSTDTAPISISGLCRSVGGDIVDGVRFEGAVITSANGNISAIGNSTASGGDNALGISIDSSATITSTNSADIYLEGNSPVGGLTRVGIRCRPGCLIETQNSGNIELRGTGKGSSGPQRGIELAHPIRSTGTGPNAGKITLFGDASTATSGSSAMGITVIDPISTVDGDILLTGIGGGGTSSSRGVAISEEIISNGLGNITINGTGGSGSNGDGLGSAGSLASIESTSSGKITLKGTANGIDGAGGIVWGNGSITSNDGDIELNGVSLATGINDEGVIIGQAGNTVSVTSTGAGNIIINATAGGTGSAGLDVPTSTSVDLFTNTGNVTITGIGTGAEPGFQNLESVGSPSMTGDLTINADTMILGADLEGGGNLTLQPIGSGVSIGIGPAAAGTLNLDATEIGFLMDGFNSITIGRNGGTHTINCTGATFLDPVTIQGSDLTVSGALAADANSIKLIQDTIAVTSSITTTGPLTFEPLTPSIGIGLATGASGTLLLDNTELGFLTAGSSLITFGHPVGEGTVDMQPFTYTSPLRVIDKQIDVNGSLISGVNDITFNIGPSSSGTLNLNDTVSTTGTFMAEGNAFDDIFNINVESPVVLDGVGGFNSLNGPNTSIWNITAQNAGNINGVTFFSNMQNIAGGNQPDTFIFSNGVGIDGLLDGGAPAAPNVLDYSNFTDMVVVLFLTPTSGIATNLGIGFINIGSFIGNAIEATDASKAFFNQLDLSYLALNPSKMSSNDSKFRKFLYGIVDKYHIYGLLYGVISNFSVQYKENDYTIVEKIKGLEPDIQVQYFDTIDN